MNAKDYRITIKAGHHIVDMKPKADLTTEISKQFSEGMAGMSDAVEAFRKYLQGISKLR